MTPAELDVKVRAVLPGIVASGELEAALPDRALYYAYMSAAVGVLKPVLVMDIGTELGYSALALATPDIGQQVHSYDIRKQRHVEQSDIHYHIRNILEDGPDEADEYARADLIFLDVDPHDGIKEKAMMQHLFRSLRPRRTVWMFFDDITLTDGMQEFWYWLKQQPGVTSMSVGHRVNRTVGGFGMASITT
jgi:predicted O-methyltransferase YrrM